MSCQEEEQKEGEVYLKECISMQEDPDFYYLYLFGEDAASLFVVEILERFFSMTRENAIEAALNIRNKETVRCACYTKEIAEMKMKSVNEFIRKGAESLQCFMKKV